MFIMKEILWTNNLNLVDEVPMMNLKFNVNAIKVPVEWGRCHYLYIACHT